MPFDANQYQALALRTDKTPSFVRDENEKKMLLPNDLAGKNAMSRLLHGLLGMTSEVGEIADMTKGHLVYGKDFDRPNVLEECGDVLWFLAVTLDACGYSLVDAMQANIAKLTARFPDGFTQEKAVNRNLLAERRALEHPHHALPSDFPTERPLGCLECGSDSHGTCGRD